MFNTDPRVNAIINSLTELCRKKGGSNASLNVDMDTCTATGDLIEFWSPRKPSNDPKIIDFERKLAAVNNLLADTQGKYDSLLNKTIETQLTSKSPELDKLQASIKTITSTQQKPLLDQLTALCQNKFLDSTTDYSLNGGCSVFPKKIVWSDSQPDPEANILVKNLRVILPQPLPEKWIIVGAVGVVVFIGIIIFILNKKL